ncbi:hypothetical protein AAHH80_35470, partial [Burkholderia pseudomallei]
PDLEDTRVVAPAADRIGDLLRLRLGPVLRDREQRFRAGADPSNIVVACYPGGLFAADAADEAPDVEFSVGAESVDAWGGVGGG